MEAAANERFVRLIPYLNLTETIGGFECVQMTLRQLILLQIAENTCLSKTAIPTVEEVAAFLWILHPDYSPKGWKRAWHLYLCRRKFIHRETPSMVSRWFETFAGTKAILQRLDHFRFRCWLDDCAKKLFRFQETVGEIRKYMEETRQDRLGGGSNSAELEYYSDAAWLEGTMGRELGKSRDETLDSPLKILFQLTRVIRHHHLGSKAGLSNKSSELLHRQN